MVRYHSFIWEDAPLSSSTAPVAAVVGYLLLLPLLSLVMRSRPALELRRITAFHNFCLSYASLVMCAGTAYELWRRYTTTGTAEWFFCEALDTQTTGPLFFWSYVYYLSKYWELFDTVLVMLQKSKVPHMKLQIYHHAAVVPMAWFWCQYQQSLQWGGLLFNTFVHILMYSYYCCRVMGWKTPWKRYITMLQIVQFVTSFVLLLITCWIWLQRRQEGSTCAGMYSLLYNCAFNATLLLQFVEVYKKGGGGSKGKTT
mmetsp:Transcript_30421/g.70043  ORF Transcript_30421/g.70043 Transcript_30421/m.70043 type:complete len:256 (+) Transcript_30421:68-835(+)